MPSAIDKAIRIQFVNGLRNQRISDACRMDTSGDFDLLIEKIECMEEALIEYTEHQSVLGDPDHDKSHNHVNYSNQTKKHNYFSQTQHSNYNNFDNNNNSSQNGNRNYSNNRSNYNNASSNGYQNKYNNNGNSFQQNRTLSEATTSTQATVNPNQKNSLLSMNQPNINPSAPQMPQFPSSTLTNSSTASNTNTSSPTNSSTMTNFSTASNTQFADTKLKQNFMLSQNVNETRIVGKCEINDEPVKFLVDTGSDNTTISQQTADRCG